MKSREWKWGGIIGLVGVAWLFLTYFLGMHGRGIGMVQVVVASSYFLIFAGFVLALRELKRSEPETGFLEGVRSGAVIAGIAAMIAMAGQYLYLRWVNPGWTDFMVAETIRHFSERGLEPSQIEAMADHARQTFGLAAYTMQAGMGTFVVGIVFSAMTMGVMQWRER